MKKGIILLLVMAIAAGCAPAQSATGPAQLSSPAVEPIAVSTAAETTAAPAGPDQPVSGGSISRAITTEPTTLDPTGPAASGQNVILPYLFDTLVYRDLENNFQPYLAEKWTTSEDGKMMTFFLKKGVVFHDGTPLNAEAVRFTFERAVAEGSKSPLVSSFANVEKIEAVGEDQVVFTMKSPSTTLLSTLSTAYAGIISPMAAEKFGDQFGLNPVGSGPFQLEKWTPGESIALVRNEKYGWGPDILQNKGPALLDRIIFKVIPDPSAQLSAFRTGEIDILFVNQPAQIEILSADPNAKLVETTLNSLIYLGFNVKTAPFDDARVRLAIAHAVNKNELVELALGGVGTVTFSPLAPTLPGFDPSLQSLEPAYDLSASETLLKEAGYVRQDNGEWKKDGSGEPLTLEILTSTRPPNETLATVLQEELKKVGIPVTIKALESTAVLEIAAKGKYQAMLSRYDWNDADVLNMYLSSPRIGRTNRSFYSNPELDKILSEAAVELDDAKRSELYSQAQKILIAEQPWIPLYTPKDYIVIRRTLQGTVFGPMGRLMLNETWLTE